ATNCHPPAVGKIPLQLFNFEPHVHYIRISPPESMKRFDIGDGRTIGSPSITIHCSGFAQLNGNDAWCQISAKKQRVFLKFHLEPTFLAFRAKSRNLLL